MFYAAHEPSSRSKVEEPIRKALVITRCQDGVDDDDHDDNDDHNKSNNHSDHDVRIPKP